MERRERPEREKKGERRGEKGGEREEGSGDKEETVLFSDGGRSLAFLWCS